MWSFRIKFLDCLSVCVNNSAVYNLHIKLFKVLDLTLCKYFNRFKFASQNFLSALQFQLYSCCFFFFIAGRYGTQDVAEWFQC